MSDQSQLTSLKTKALLLRPDPQTLDVKGPLCVDLDGTIVLTDTLLETALNLIKEQPLLLCYFPFWLLKGRAYLKYQIASRIQLDYATLPYNTAFLSYLTKQKNKGRRIILVTAANEIIAQGVSDHLKLFNEQFASNANINLSGTAKANLLIEKFGAGGFDYAGNSMVDYQIFRKAFGSILVNPSWRLAAKARKKLNILAVSRIKPALLINCIKAMRLHQWTKNLLVFLPLLLAKTIDLELFSSACLAFLAFSLLASSIYVINDLLDIPADRKHPKKKHRPFASGSLPLSTGLWLSPLLMIIAGIISSYLPWSFSSVLIGYLAINFIYNFKLKQLAVADVIALAALYTSRLFAGGLSTDVDISSWLLAFSSFFFLSLALIKRSSELKHYKDQNISPPQGRGYETQDLPLLGALGSASGYMSVVVLSLYINSDAVKLVYARPQMLWLLCPLLVYWISRYWLLANRGKMYHDPVVFAIRDKASYIVCFFMFIIWILARGGYFA